MLIIDQFNKANLNIWNNNWRTVYDYTWNEGDNWAVNEEPVNIDFPNELHKYKLYTYIIYYYILLFEEIIVNNFNLFAIILFCIDMALQVTLENH